MHGVDFAFAICVEIPQQMFSDVPAPLTCRERTVMPVAMWYLNIFILSCTYNFVWISAAMCVFMSNQGKARRSVPLCHEVCTSAIQLCTPATQQSVANTWASQCSRVAVEVGGEAFPFSFPSLVS